MTRPPIIDPGRLPPRKPKVTEKHIADAVKGLLEIDGWRVFHMEPLSNVIQRRYSAELGCPDLLALRYGAKRADSYDYSYRTECQALWLEIKRRGAKPKKHQERWHAEERMLGAEVWVVDDYEFFRKCYISSGLNRRIRV